MNQVVREHWLIRLMAAPVGILLLSLMWYPGTVVNYWTTRGWPARVLLVSMLPLLLLSVPFDMNVVGALIQGMGQKVQPVSLFIHEAAENLRFAQIGFNHPVLGWGPWQKDGTRKFDNYGKAHNYAKRREAVIRQELNISGGFAGGALQR